MINRLLGLFKSKVSGGSIPSSGAWFYSPQGYLIAYGTTVPTDGTAGYAPGCIFVHTDGTAGTTDYINEGTSTSCDFNPLAALTAAQEALLGATAGVATASKAVILDASGHVASGAMVLDDITPGTGISTGTGTVCEHRVTKIGGLYKTEILIDLTGLNDGGTANDIIGVDGGTANCHIGQITAAKNGTIISGRVTCFETPAGGDPDIDIYHADGATGAQDANIDSADSGSAVQLINHGDWTAEDLDYLTTMPAADEYLYLACGTCTGADYTAGILLIELWGV